MPSHFTNEDRAIAKRLIHDHPFAMLISCAQNEPWITHCPLVCSEKDGSLTLHGHMAKANTHHELWSGDKQVTAVFQGPHGYVSPNWYAPENAVKAVPTWNYCVLHMQGQIVLRDTEAAKDEALKTLIGHMEPAYAAQWRGLPEEYQHKMLSGIVAFDVMVSDMKIKLKLSQNRPAADKPRVIAQLQTQGEAEQALAAWMREVNGIVSSTG